MTTIGYARVSTALQNNRSQIAALEAAGCTVIYSDEASGSKKDRPELQALLKYARGGDTIVVWRLDRLARSLKHLIETVTDFEKRGIALRSITETIDTTSTSGKLIFHIFGAIAEFERNLIRERTTAALDVARLRGKVGGRPRALTPQDLHKASQWLSSKTMTKAEIAKALGVSSSTLYRELRRAPSL